MLGLATLSFAGCFEECPGVTSNPWEASALTWTASGGVAVNIGQYNGYNGLAEKSCEQTRQIFLDANGRRESDSPSLVLACSDAPGCDGSPTSLHSAPSTFGMKDGSTVELIPTPPSFKRVDAHGAVLYDTALDFDQLTDVFPSAGVIGGVTYVFGQKGAASSVAQLDVNRGAIVWTTIVLDGGQPK